jgi:NitT/TauT family transport system ATP-binding protein
VSFIELSGVGKTFRGRDGRPWSAVAAFDLALREGEFFCLLGPSGCGKSTILSLLAGFERPSVGTITLAGQPITGPSRDRAVVFQGDDSLYPWLTARENVAFGPRMRGVARRERLEAVDRVIETVGLTAAREKYPSELSGGMKQRVQIARALVNDPRTLLMDEPMGALDAQTREVLQDELRRLWRATGKTIVFITHDIDEALLLGSRVGLMSAGPGGTLREVIDIPFAGAPARTDPRYAALYERIHAVVREEVDRARAEPAARAA